MHQELEPRGLPMRPSPRSFERAMCPHVTSEADRWRAVTSRTPEADGRFYYAVRTTGVFCRPVCKSRMPRRENVEFFDTVESALRAGYRACKRCRPMDRGGGDGVTDAIVEACRLLASEDATQNCNIADAVGLSESYFQRSFKKRFGVTPQQYRRRVLAERGRGTIGRARSVTESIYEAGYSSSSRFYDGIGRELGMSPSVAHHGGLDEQIQYTVLDCSLGQALIAWTPRGVCEVGFSDSAEQLLRRLEAHFPKASLEASDGAEWAEALIRSVEMASPVDVPLDIRGTAFQERVWQELRKIPLGETRTYSEIAHALGDPLAARAVAGACAANKLALLIPCHRVVRKDGNLSGYRWGIERKRALLRRESERR
jgi:AraC family transcriptional regulator of adaptative response/methylated-DNA-[protein]-cysteine methyltransferase